jgi:poly-gamma-glutamate capsule biosynthesis protein CapA/YwtB (metallophosphatase superfamily)
MSGAHRCCTLTDAMSRNSTLMLTGDVMLGRGIDQIHCYSVDPAIYESYMRSATGYVELAEETSGPIPRKVPPEYVWGDALAVLESLRPHARVINLETSITTASRPWPGKGIQYRMHPANVDVPLAAGIDCAVLANNHVLDWGREGLLETLETLRRAGVKTCGAGANLAEAAAPAVLEIPAGRLLVFGVCDESSGVPESWAALPARSGVHLLPDLSPATALRLARHIDGEPRQPGDRVVVSIHWGGNWGYDVPAEQERFAKVLIDNGGVDMVHGHSSHHPKGIELYGGRLIFYGAGDLITDYEGICGHEAFRPHLSLLYLPTLGATGALDSMLLVPLRLRCFRLERAQPDESEWLRTLLARESRGLTFEPIEDGLITARRVDERAVTATSL